MMETKMKTMFTIYVDTDIYEEIFEHATNKFKGKISPAANDLIKTGIKTQKRRIKK